MAGKKKNSRAITAILALLLAVSCAVFIWAGYTLITRNNEYSAARDEYDELRSMFMGGSATQAADGSTNGDKNTMQPDTSSKPQAGATAAQTAASQSNVDSAQPDGNAVTTAEASAMPQAQPDGNAANETYTAPAAATAYAAEHTPAPAATAAPEATAFVSPVDFEGLWKIDPEIIAWVEIPGTDISYPVAQTGDNEKYLTTDIKGETNRSGAIFADKDSQSDLYGAHSIIYGHHMRDGSMFARLVDFKDADFFAQHDMIILYTPERTMYLTIVAAYAQNASESSVRQFEFADAAEFETFLTGCISHSQNVREGVDYSGVDRLYSLVTCSYEADNMRTIVHAVELPEAQAQAIHAQCEAALAEAQNAGAQG